MGAPPVVMNDQIQGPVCPTHMIPGPLGAPIPGPPMPFSAPILMGTVSTVLIGGQPAAVMGASGYNTPPHVGLHPADPAMVPTMQQAQIVMGSATVMIGGQPAATSQSQFLCCVPPIPGMHVPTVTTVLIG